MGVALKTPIVTAGQDYETSRQRMLDSYLRWLREDPRAMALAPSEIGATHSAMTQITQLVMEDRRS